MAKKKKEIRLKKNSNEKIPKISLTTPKEPSYITFNFSFLTNTSKYNLTSNKPSNEQKNILLHRLVELSQKNLVELTANTDKKLGLEKISRFNGKDKLNSLTLHPEFFSSSRHGSAGSGYWIFRLCPNNNPLPTRIIGKLINDTFYIMYIDWFHELYAKRK